MTLVSFLTWEDNSLCWLDRMTHVTHVLPCVAVSEEY